VDLRLVAAAGSALVVGVGIGVAGDRLLTGSPDADPRLIDEGTLTALPRAPVAVRAERVVLPAGFRSRHRHGGPTFNFVDSGHVEIGDERGHARYRSGDFFYEPGGRVHTIDVVEAAVLRVVRLLPPGARATTEVP
jgi:quercetin dioxygenase-like cupin family protein